MSTAVEQKPNNTAEAEKPKSLPPKKEILDLSEKIYEKLNVNVDGDTANINATDDTYYANLPEGHTREVHDVALEYKANHSAGALLAVGRKGLETLAKNKKVQTISGVIEGGKGIENRVNVQRDYTAKVAGKEIEIKGRTTMTVEDASIGKIGQMGRVHAQLKAMAADTLKS